MDQKPWWTITYLNTGAVYHSEKIPFRLLPDLEEVSMDLGHKFSNQEISCEVFDRIRLDLYTGAIWIDNKLVVGVKNASRLILHKRNFNPSHGAPAYQHIHAGLVDDDGNGYLVRITETGDIHLERCVVSATVYG